MNFSIGIVAHYSRWDRADRLSKKIDAEVVTVDYDGKVGAGANHEQCYEWLFETSTAPWCIVMEDDAIPVDGFRDQLSRVLASAPNTGLLSLYLGRFRPPHYQASIARVIAREENFFTCRELLHHVAVAIRTPLIPQMLAYIRTDTRYRAGKLPIDEAIGQWARSVRMPVAYCHPSIVNHDTRLTTVIPRHVSRHRDDDGSRPTTDLRQAWAFGTRKVWKKSVAVMPEPA